MKQTYKGSCHCNRVRFEVDADLDHVRVCDCSICRRRGALIHRVEENCFRLLTPIESCLSISGIPRPPKIISALTVVSCRSVARVPLPTNGESMFVVSKASSYRQSPSSTCTAADWTEIVPRTRLPPISSLSPPTITNTNHEHVPTSSSATKYPSASLLSPVLDRRGP